MDFEAFVSEYPNLYHMAEVGNWEGIQQRGLLSTSELLNLYGYSGERREELEARHRPEMRTIEAPGLPPALLRDQKVLDPKELSPLLTGGTTVEQWYRLLNSKVFFWARWGRLEMLLGARAYRSDPHVVIKVDTRALFEGVGPRATVTDMNTGSVLPLRRGPAPKRGPETFRRLSDFPEGKEVVEVAVETRVAEILSFSHSAEVWKKPWKQPAQSLSTLWTRP